MSQCDLSSHIAYQAMRLDDTNTVAPPPMSLAHFYKKVIDKKRTATRWRHNVTSDDLLTGNDDNSAPGISSIAYLIMILGELGRSDAY